MRLLKKHYHWAIAAVALLIMFIYGGAANTLGGLHLLPVTKTLGIARAQYSLAGAVSHIIAAFGSMMAGRVIARFGYRRAATVFLLTAVVAYLLFAGVSSYAMFLLAYALLGLSNGVCASTGVTQIVYTWFHKHRGLVLGLVMSATGIGGSILGVIQTAMIEQNFRLSYLTIAIFLFILAVLVAIFIRNKPSDMGLTQFGAGEEIQEKKKRAASDFEGFTSYELFHSPFFYLLLACTMLSCTGVWMASNVMVPHFQDVGLSATQAGTMQSLYLFCLTGTKFVYGSLCDTIGAKKVTILCLVCGVIAIVVMIFVNSLALAVLVSVLFAFALPIVTITIPMLALELFGERASADYLGVVLAMSSVASMLSGVISNGIFDYAGSYRLAFCIAIGLLIVLIILYLLTYHMVERKKRGGTDAV
ncbi:MAG: MFS transporter [Ruminococcaceae bacterium]|nr:MFS transporter [Oscillospiraceae bacterium]